MSTREVCTETAKLLLLAGCALLLFVLAHGLGF